MGPDEIRCDTRHMEEVIGKRYYTYGTEFDKISPGPRRWLAILLTQLNFRPSLTTMPLGKFMRRASIYGNPSAVNAALGKSPYSILRVIWRSRGWKKRRIKKLTSAKEELKDRIDGELLEILAKKAPPLLLPKPRPAF